MILERLELTGLCQTGESNGQLMTSSINNRCWLFKPKAENQLTLLTNNRL